MYNSADPRLGAGGFRALLANAAAGAELPRLPSTRVEAAACARAYSAGNQIVLTGLDASRAGLVRALAARPAVLHVAAHVAGTASNDPVIVLSRGPDGSADGLTARDIAALDVPGSLVVMSGCASGRANALPGDGLMGLGRAWLAAGARSVIATHWPVQDEAGALLSAFYREFRDSGDASAALRSARMQMIRARGPRANPAYWAAYELMERSN